MRRFLPVAVSTLMVATWALAPQAVADPPDLPATVAVWSSQCDFVTHKKVDPIYQWNQESNHMHAFSGHESPSKTMDPVELRNAGNGENECSNPDLSDWSSWGVQHNRSSYWMPALRGLTVVPTDWIEPSRVLVYYRNAGVNPNTIEAWPLGFSTRAGDPQAVEDQPENVMYWSCVAQQREESGPNEVNFGPTIPETCPVWFGDEADNNPFYLRLIVIFPNCIDKDNFESHDDMWIPTLPKYAEEISNPQDEWTHHCADTDYTPIPQLQVGYRWPLSEVMGITEDPEGTWNLTTLKLSSDIQSGQDDGISGHADVMSGWSNQQMERLMKTCYWSNSGGTGPRNCGAIHVDAYADWDR